MTGLEIVNAALGNLGCDRVSGLDDDSTAEGRLVHDEYEAIRDAALEARQWTFARGRMQLVQDATVPAFGYAFQYIIPTTVLSVVRCYDGRAASLAGLWADDCSLSPVKFEREGGYVLTNTDDPLYALVLMKVTENSFSPLFSRALIAQLSADWAISLTESRPVMQTWAEIAESRFLAAAVSDGKQGTYEVVTPQKFPGRRR